MSTKLGTVFDLVARQHGVVARWQLTRLRLPKSAIDVLVRGRERPFRGVYLLGETAEWTHVMAAVLALGPKAVASHGTAVAVLEMRPLVDGDIHVSVPHDGFRAVREGIAVHRRRGIAWGHWRGIPVTSPTQSLLDAKLEPYELYRAIEQAERLDLPVDLSGEVVRLQRTVRGRTRSDAEARFILLCHDRGLPLPLVNHYLHGVETDFHWPQAKLVVEVDGYEFHKDRAQFEEDRRRALVHEAAGFHVIRPSALQVQHDSELVLSAVRAHL